MTGISARFFCRVFGLLLMAGLFFPSAQGTAYDRIYTVTGKIVAIEGKVMTLEGAKKLQPFHEIDIPDWVSVGERAKFSYYVRQRGNCYLEIVKPGEELTVKEKLEFLQKTKN